MGNIDINNIVSAFLFLFALALYFFTDNMPEATFVMAWAAYSKAASARDIAKYHAY